MLLDLTLPITPSLWQEAKTLDNPALEGHIGTHFDVMDKEFPLEYTQRSAVVFDVSHIRGRDVEIGDVQMDALGPDMFVAFYTGFVDEVAYGTPAYFATHPQLSMALVEALLEKRISVIGIDCAGIRRTPEHVPMDQRCADQGVFVIYYYI